MDERPKLPAYFFVTVLTLLIAGSWLLPGYLFGTDFPGPRRFDGPKDLSSSAPLQLLLFAVGTIASAQLATKLLILLALFVAGLEAFRLSPYGGFVPRAMAATIYMVNPFVYGRLHYGHFFLLAGYAALPRVVHSMRRFMMQPDRRTAVILATAISVTGILDLHLFVPVGLLLAAFFVAHSVSRRHDPPYVQRLTMSIGLVIATVTFESSYWLIPILTSTSQEGRTLAAIGQPDLVAFKTSSDPVLGLVPNVLGLYGFWAEDTGRFASMKLFVPFWPAITSVMLLLIAMGAMALILRRTLADFPGSRPWVFGLLGAGAIAVVLEMGAANPVTEPVVRLLDTVFPPYRGMRDAGKWAALIALVYAQLIPFGGIMAIRWLREQVKPPQIDVAEALATGLLLALPLYYGNGLLFGSHGQIQPSSYPTGWYQADKLLVADPHPGRTLFLPWHLYLGLDFVRNTNNIVASPAPSFFGVPVLISKDPEVQGIAPPADPDQVAIAHLVAEGSAADWARVLAGRNIKYVLVAREVDWAQYRFLGSQPGFELVADYGSIVVYRNMFAP